MTFLKNTRDRINADYAELVKEFPELLKEPEKLMETLSPEESLALRYLYIAMPVSDMANYDCEVFMDSVKQGVWLWKNLKSVQELPDEIYLNYVLLHRVNEEEIRPCRELFGRDIIEKISQGSRWKNWKSFHRRNHSGDKFLVCRACDLPLRRRPYTFRTGCL